MDASVNRIPSSKDERAFCLALYGKHSPLKETEYSLKELLMLVKTAGGITVGTRLVRRDAIDPAFIVGRGVVEELKMTVRDMNIRLVVFDLNTIKPAQVRNLEEALKCRVIGRTEVILDIFARRAKSSEAKIQVELAQLKYILPRLKGLGGVLSRLGGGIGTRGPGEKMLETDRRHISRRIIALSRKLKTIARHRERIRKSRTGEIVGAVVGYTNAGKSSLINLLAKDDLFVENKLFATLESYTRSVYLGDGRKILLTDTVGFIRNLPAHLLESFHSTLEEIAEADFLIHVVDIASPDIDMDIRTVDTELAAIESTGKPTILFFNKTDLLDGETAISLERSRYPGAVAGSVVTGQGIEALMESVRAFHKKLSPHADPAHYGEDKQTP